MEAKRNNEVDDSDFLKLLHEPTLIDRFQGEYAFLSNFHESPFTYEGREWPTVEHAFQAQKSLNEGEQELIRSAATPLKAKQMGRKVLLRPDWNDVKEDIMHEILSCKFNHDLDLARRLLLTGYAELVEGNTWHDNFWGNCTCGKCIKQSGKNLTGKLLMQVRKELQQGAGGL